MDKVGGKLTNLYRQGDYDYVVFKPVIKKEDEPTDGQICKSDKIVAKYHKLVENQKVTINPLTF